MSWHRALELAAARPLDFTLQYPPSRAYFRGRFQVAAKSLEAELHARWAASTRALLYVHVPFCEAKCFYCNFAVDLRKGHGLHQRYVDAVTSQLAQLEALLPERATVPGIDLGGGTPTLLEPALLEKLLGALSRWRRRCEVAWPLSIETTPRIAAAEPEKLEVLRAGGVDRVSVGLQSTHDETLASVNRRAQRALGEQALANLVAAGFRRVNADLVFGLPGQNLAQWREDLERVAQQPLDSVTTYDCLYRGEGRALPGLTAQRPTPGDYGALYDLAYETLTARGFHARYGSLNFSRHAGETGTSPYFEGRLLDGLPYVGAGNYASTLLGDAWSFAPFGVEAYAAAVERGAALPVGEGYRLPPEERWAKYALLSLSFGLLSGRRFGAFSGGIPLEVAFAAPLEHALDQGWLVRQREAPGAEGAVETGDTVYGIAPGQFRQLPKLRALFYSTGAVDWVTRQPT